MCQVLKEACPPGALAKGGEYSMTGIIRHDPLRSLFAFPRWLDDLDVNLQRGLKVHETQKDIILEAVVAGVPSKDVDIDIEDGVVTIKAEAKDEQKTADEYKSSAYSYYYTTALSGGQWDKAEAKVKDGVVTVTIPKTPSSRPRKVTVKTE